MLQFGVAKELGKSLYEIKTMTMEELIGWSAYFLIINEDRKYAISSYLRKKVVHSDHYSIILDFDISWKKKKPDRHEHFNFKVVHRKI